MIFYIFFIAIGILLLALFYVIYQLIRNNAVFKIRRKWRDRGDCRWYKYSYEDMYDPKKENYFGLQYPKEKYFK